LRLVAAFAPGDGADAFSRKLRLTSDLIVLPAISPTMLELWTDPRFGPYLRSGNISSLVVAPLTAAEGDAVRGALSVWREGRDPAFSTDEVELIESAARLVAHAAMPTGA
jgi:hypothetical protein